MATYRNEKIGETRIAVDDSRLDKRLAEDDEWKKLTDKEAAEVAKKAGLAVAKPEPVAEAPPK
jgi:hypothetical protein